MATDTIDPVKLDINNLDKSDWKTYRFDEIAQNISERVDPNDTDLEVYVGLEHLDSESLHITRHGSPDDVNGTKLRFYKGDIIFGRRRAYQRKAGIATWDGFCSAHALVLRANPDVIHPDLFPFFIHSDLFMNRAVDISVGSLSPTINWGTLKEQKFLIPPVESQNKLIVLLNSSQNLLEAKQLFLNKLKQSYIVKIEKELINKDYQKVNFSELGNLGRGVSYKPDDLIDEYSEDSCIILRANNINESKINFDDVKILGLEKIKEEQLLEKGNFAICMSNGSKHLVGKAAELKQDNRNIAVGAFCASMKPKSSENRLLLRHLFASNSYRLAIHRILSGSTINNLKPSDIQSLFLRVKTENNKSTINELEYLVGAINEVVSDIDNFNVLQKSLINQVF